LHKKDRAGSEFKRFGWVGSKSSNIMLQTIYRKLYNSTSCCGYATPLYGRSAKIF